MHVSFNSTFCCCVFETTRIYRIGFIFCLGFNCFRNSTAHNYTRIISTSHRYHVSKKCLNFHRKLVHPAPVSHASLTAVSHRRRGGHSDARKGPAANAITPALHSTRWRRNREHSAGSPYSVCGPRGLLTLPRGPSSFGRDSLQSYTIPSAGSPL